ncbi:MAG: cyclic nucleotide-binding domain-containing protein [Myxococcales bacterium]|nr:cyclic nucleotide-binding domain-containing protein [Myxococcales bacterium]
MSAPRPPAIAITADMLRSNRLFDGMDQSTLEKLAAELPSETAQPGQVLIREGEIAEHMFLVVQGEMEVLHKGGSERDVRVALLGPGDWVGEMAILDTQPRSATVRSLAPSLLMRLTGPEVQRLTKTDSGDQYTILVTNIARELGRRLRVADRIIANAAAPMVERYVQESRRPPPPK